MNPFVELLVLVPVLGVLAVVFGRNAQKGMRTGAVYAQSTRYLRAEQPIFFWIAVGFSTLFAAVCAIALVVSVWALVTLG